MALEEPTTRSNGILKNVSFRADAKLIEAARDDAKLVLARDATLTSPRGEALRSLLYFFGRDEAIRLIRAR